METVRLWQAERRPLVTAVTLVYNKLDFCQRAVGSLLAYNGLDDNDIDIVLWDQGSPYPGVSEWLDIMRDKVDVQGGNFNIGVGAALNNVIDSTDSNYIFKLDDDSALLPFTLPLLVIARTVAQMTGFPLGVLSADVIGVGKSEGVSTAYELMPGLTLECAPCVGGGAVLISRDVIEDVGPFRADRLYGVEDGDFAARCLAKGYMNAYLRGAYHVSYCRGPEADTEIDNWKLKYAYGETDEPFDKWRAN